MNTGYKMFLLAAEEMNFSKAADRAFVTQQCFSDHIRRLEESCHVTLFHRKPKLKLTLEGTAMLRYLLRIQALENRMFNELSDISTGVRGTINFGVSTTRGYIIIPQLIPQFQEAFPNVDIQVHLDDTKILEHHLLGSRIDVLLGVDASQHALFNRSHIYDDPLYLVISDQLLKTHFADSYETCIKECRAGADLKHFEKVPFVLGHNDSTTTFAVNQFLMKHHLELRIPIHVSNFDILMELCRTGRYATISPQFHLRQLIQMYQIQPEERNLYVFPIRHLDKTMCLEIITHQDAQPLQHTKIFINMLKDFLLHENNRIKEFIPYLQKYCTPQLKGCELYHAVN